MKRKRKLQRTATEKSKSQNKKRGKAVKRKSSAFNLYMKKSMTGIPVYITALLFTQPNRFCIAEKHSVC